MTSKRALLPVLAILPLILAACGGGGGDGGGAKGEAAKPAKEIIADASRELAALSSYHVDGTQADKDGTTRLAGDVTADGRVKLQMRQQGSTVGLIVVGSEAYFKADAAFWRRTAGSAGDALIGRLADRWVKSPSGVDKDLKDMLNTVHPKTLSYCIVHATGPLTKGAAEELDGQQAIIVLDKGGPGNAPNKIWIAASGRPLPLRTLQTGPEPPGGKRDPRCDGSDSSPSKASDIRFSGFDKPVDIAAPKDAVDLSKLGAGSQS